MVRSTTSEQDMLSRSGRALAVVCILTGASGILVACAANDPDRLLPLSRLQFIGTHNAYHIEPDAGLRTLWRSQPAFRQSDDPPFVTLMYTHPPLATQAELGLRFFELDLHWDPEGGRYSSTAFLAPLVQAGLEPDAPFDPEGQLSRPGIKVFHGADDMRSTCLLLSNCLRELDSWLNDHPDEGPILVQFEAKDLAGAGGTMAAAWSQLEAEILAIIPRSRIYAPADLASRPADLRNQAISSRWPDRRSISDQFVFIFNGSDADTQSYIQALAEDQASLMFPALSDATNPLAAFVSRNDPLAADIPEISSRGQMVITYADWRTFAARSNNPAGRDAAFSSGAQLIVTDYPFPDRRLSDYFVRFEQGFVRPRLAQTDVVSGDAGR
jgi:hypothetical protein